MPTGTAHLVFGSELARAFGNMLADAHSSCFDCAPCKEFMATFVEQNLPNSINTVRT